MRDAFSSFAFTGANDEKVGLLGSLPGVAAAAQPDPGLSSFALSGLGLETGCFLQSNGMFAVLNRISDFGIRIFHLTLARHLLNRN